MKDEKLGKAWRSFSIRAKERLEEKEAAGYSGWDAPRFPTQYLGDIFRDMQVLKVHLGPEHTLTDEERADAMRKLLDISNRAMFMYDMLESRRPLWGRK